MAVTTVSIAVTSSPPSAAILSTVRAIASSRSLDGLMGIILPRSPSMGSRLSLRAIAFVTVSKILPLKVFGRAGILAIAFQTFTMPPAAPGRIVFTPFCAGLANLAVF